MPVRDNGVYPALDLPCVAGADCAEARRRLWEIIAHWDRDNPVGRGPNWFSNMEVALRLLRFLFADGIMTQLGRSVSRLREMIHEHYIHVVSDWKATRRTMKGGNHLIVELAALGAYESLSRKQGPG